MNKATRVTIDWTEAGAIDGTTITGENVWAKVDTLLTMMLGAYRANGGRGYAKTGFTVEWEDGETYTGRMDLGDSFHGEGEQSLGRHINAYLDFVTGPNRPGYINDERVASAAAFRETHEVG